MSGMRVVTSDLTFRLLGLSGPWAS